MSCTYKKFKNERLCTNDLSHEITIGQRVIAGDQPDDVAQTNTTVTPIFTLWAAHSNTNPYKVVESLVPDRKITDVFYVRAVEWDDLVSTASMTLDCSKHILSTNAIYYRIDRVLLNDGGQIMSLYCERTGTAQEGLA